MRDRLRDAPRGAGRVVMANTPEPCDTCIHCAYDIASEDKPSAGAWCEEGLPMGRPGCWKYRNWANATGHGSREGNALYRAVIAARKAAAGKSREALHKVKQVITVGEEVT